MMSKTMNKVDSERLKLGLIKNEKIEWTAIENIRGAAKYLERAAKEIEDDPLLKGYVINVNLKWFPNMDKTGLYFECWNDVSSDRNRDTSMTFYDIKNITINESNAMEGKE